MNHSVYFLFGGEEYAGNFAEQNFPPESTTTYHYDFFSVEDARMLRSFLSQHVGSKNVFLLRIEKILGESQNALLKICEEFTDGVLIFSFPSSTRLLDTFLSRGEIYYEEKKGDASGDVHDAAKKALAFLAASYLDRIKLFDQYVKENKDSDPRVFIRDLIESLIQYEKGTHLFESKSYINKQTYRDVLHLLTFQKSSPKQLYEYLAITIQK